MNKTVDRILAVLLSLLLACGMLSAAFADPASPAPGVAVDQPAEDAFESAALPVAGDGASGPETAPAILRPRRAVNLTAALRNAGQSARRPRPRRAFNLTAALRSSLRTRHLACSANNLPDKPRNAGQSARRPPPP